MTVNGPTDFAPVLCRAVRGDRLALAAIYRRYWRVALAGARRVFRQPADAEDAAQDAFLDLLARAGRDRATFAGRAAPGRWLYVVARYCALRVVRDRGRRRPNWRRYVAGAAAELRDGLRRAARGRGPDPAAGLLRAEVRGCLARARAAADAARATVARGRPQSAATRRAVDLCLRDGLTVNDAVRAVGGASRCPVDFQIGKVYRSFAELYAEYDPAG